MNSDKGTENGGRNSSATPALDLLKQKLGNLRVPRMLTPSEIDLLQQSKVEVDRVVGEILASKDDRSESTPRRH